MLLSADAQEMCWQVSKCLANTAEQSYLKSLHKMIAECNALILHAYCRELCHVSNTHDASLNADIVAQCNAPMLCDIPS